MDRLLYAVDWDASRTRTPSRADLFRVACVRDLGADGGVDLLERRLAVGVDENRVATLNGGRSVSKPPVDRLSTALGQRRRRQPRNVAR
jgi:hypothetical protein